MLIKQSASRYCNSLPQAVLSTINAQAQDFKLELLLESRVVGPNFSFEQKILFCCSLKVVTIRSIMVVVSCI